VSARPPDPFFASRPAPAQAEDVADLIRTVELAQDGEVETTVDDVREDWATADLDRDAVFVREGDRLVAYGLVAAFQRGALADGYVHPGRRGRGLGRFLVRALEARGRELAPRGPKVETCVSVNDSAGQRLLEEEGYVGVRRWLRMLVDLESEPAVPPLDGVEVRPLRVGEERRFHEVFERSFDGHWGHVPKPFDAWWHELERASGGGRRYLFVAERRGQLVGQASGVPRRFGMGWVGTLGVLPEARGRGIGRALLLRCLAEFWSSRERRVGLAVDAGNETGARLYESVGMRTSFGAIAYEKDIAPAGTVSA
jgi:ribosomal protein S18 acetylase RimI-like enzyme